MNTVKLLAKKILTFFHLDITQNMKYDRQTQQVIARVLQPGSCTIDVGCHKGEMLDLFIKAAPQGTHFAFEPIPQMYAALKQKYTGQNIHIYSCALAEANGHAEFNHVKNAPAYSGLKQREYAVEKPEIEKIPVELKPLDEVIPTGTHVDLIKVDVEGAELGVFKGAKRILATYRPVTVFECGLGASDFYGTKPEEVYDLLVSELGMKLSTMARWLKNKPQLSRAEFCKGFYDKTDYYFIAYA